MDISLFISNTMLIERLCGVSAYVLGLIVICNAIYVSKRASVKRCLVLYALYLTALAFFYVPGDSADLTRLLVHMHDWSYLDFPDLISLMGRNASPAYPLYFWAIGQFGVDGLLPAVTTFIGMMCLFSCIWDYADRFECNKRSVVLAVAVVMSTGFFVSLISDIRNMLAFMIIARCFYGECYRKSSVLAHIILYAFAAFLHPAALFVVVLRMVLLIFERKSSLAEAFLSFFLVVLLFALLFFYASDYLAEMVRRGSNYLASGEYSYFWEYLINGIMMAYAVYVLISSRKAEAKREETRPLKQALVVLCVISIAAAPFSFAIFTRFATLVLFLMPPLVMELLEDEAFLAKSRFVTLTKLEVIVCLLLACARGNLSGYKFFLLK